MTPPNAFLSEVHLPPLILRVRRILTQNQSLVACRQRRAVMALLFSLIERTKRIGLRASILSLLEQVMEMFYSLLRIFRAIVFMVSVIRTTKQFSISEAQVAHSSE